MSDPTKDAPVSIEIPNQDILTRQRLAPFVSIDDTNFLTFFNALIDSHTNLCWNPNFFLEIAEQIPLNERAWNHPLLSSSRVFVAAVTRAISTKLFHYSLSDRRIVKIPQEAPTCEKLPKLLPLGETPFSELIVSVQNIDSFDCANQLLNNSSKKLKILVLANGNWQKPGGSWENGNMAQEEELYRRSNLCASDSDCYPILEYSALISRDVSVFRGNSVSGYPFLDSPFKVDVITTSAYDMQKRAIESRKNPIFTRDGKNYLQPEYVAKTCRKLIAIFHFAAQEKYEKIILGAIGCGIFGNPPQDIAKIFDFVLSEYAGYIPEVVFAILGDNREVFEREIHGSYKPNSSCWLPKKEWNATDLGLCSRGGLCPDKNSCSSRHPLDCLDGINCSKSRDSVHRVCVSHPGLEFSLEGGVSLSGSSRSLSSSRRDSLRTLSDSKGPLTPPPTPLNSRLRISKAPLSHAAPQGFSEFLGSATFLLEKKEKYKKIYENAIVDWLKCHDLPKELENQRSSIEQQLLTFHEKKKEKMATLVETIYVSVISQFLGVKLKAYDQASICEAVQSEQFCFKIKLINVGLAVERSMISWRALSRKFSLWMRKRDHSDCFKSKFQTLIATAKDSCLVIKGSSYLKIAQALLVPQFLDEISYQFRFIEFDLTDFGIYLKNELKSEDRDFFEFSRLVKDAREKNLNSTHLTESEIKSFQEGVCQILFDVLPSADRQVIIKINKLHKDELVNIKERLNRSSSILEFIPNFLNSHKELENTDTFTSFICTLANPTQVEEFLNLTIKDIIISQPKSHYIILHNEISKFQDFSHLSFFLKTHGITLNSHPRFFQDSILFSSDAPSVYNKQDPPHEFLPPIILVLSFDQVTRYQELIILKSPYKSDDSFNASFYECMLWNLPETINIQDARKQKELLESQIHSLKEDNRNQGLQVSELKEVLLGKEETIAELKLCLEDQKTLLLAYSNLTTMVIHERYKKKRISVKDCSVGYFSFLFQKHYYPTQTSVKQVIDQLVNPLGGLQGPIYKAIQTRVQQSLILLKNKHETMTEIEKETLLFYSADTKDTNVSNIYSLIGESFRSRFENAWTGFLFHLISAFYKCPSFTRDVTLYRGVRSELVKDHHAVGKFLIWVTLTSATFDPQTAENFLFLNANKGPKTLIEFIKHKGGRQIGELSLFPEGEVLFPPNTIFKVVGNDSREIRGENVNVIVLEEIWEEDAILSMLTIQDIF